MRKYFKLTALAIMAAAVLSCQKDQGGNTGMSPEEQIAYMDTAGQEALSQIEPSDFQKLADLVNDLEKDSLDVEFDNQSQIRLAALLVNMVSLKGLVIDTDKLTGTFTIDGKNSSYTSSTGLKVIYKSGSRSYTAELAFTKGSKEVKIGNVDLSDYGIKQTVDVYLIVPSAVKVDVYYGSELYAGTDVDIDCSSMPSDWSDLTPSQINASLSGSIFIGGKGKYSLVFNKIKMGGGQLDFDGTLYGNKGAFLASGTCSAGYTVSDELDIILDEDSLNAYANLIDKVEARTTSSGCFDVFLAKSATASFSVNGNSSTVTFSDGTVMDTNEVFSEQNFPKTILAATEKIIAFMQMFNIDY